MKSSVSFHNRAVITTITTILIVAKIMHIKLLYVFKILESLAKLSNILDVLENYVAFLRSGSTIDVSNLMNLLFKI